MSLAIILGFQDTGSTAPFTVIYAGRDASAARAIAENPPAGIVRTESMVNPITHRKRYFPTNLPTPSGSPEGPPAPGGEPPVPPDEPVPAAKPSHKKSHG